MIYYIYVLQNTINNKIYIGQTNNMSKRWREHKAKDRLKNKRSPLYSAINKYGFENFKMFSIEEFDNSFDADDAEKFWIEIFNTRNRYLGYNLAEGGRVNRSFKHSEKWKEEKSKNMKDYFAKNGSPNKGRKKSSEQVEKMKSKNCGEKSPFSKLTNDQVKEIRDFYLENKNCHCVTELSIKYNVSKNSIYCIVKNKRYKI